MSNKQRADRLAQQRHRGSRRSYVTEIENLQILLAWASGDLSEGQASKALGVGRVEARKMYDDACSSGCQLYQEQYERHITFRGIHRCDVKSK